MGCPRCGYPAEPGVICRACGSAVLPMPPPTYWVATPPSESSPSYNPDPEPPPPRRYTGPPSYPVPPRWGFPLLGWRRSVPLGTEVVDAGERMRVLAATAVPLLWITAGLALITSGAEAWRYQLLLASRVDAVPAGPLHASDALVTTGGVLTVLASMGTAVVTLAWLVRATAAAARSAGVNQPRPAWQLVAGALVPGVNLVVPGAVLAELEHAALGMDRDRRPRPSPLVALWWALWAAGLLSAGLTVLWGLRQTVQAQADAVLLHVVTDLLAGLVAIGTVQVVRRLTGLLSPVRQGTRRRMVPVRVTGEPSPAG